MAAKKKRSQRSAASSNGREAGTRLRRTDEEKVRLVQQVIASSNQSAEIKSLGIYPNQFYDWKKKFADQLGGAASTSTTGTRGKRGRPAATSQSAAEEAKAFIHGKAALLDKLRKQRNEIDELINQLER